MVIRFCATLILVGACTTQTMAEEADPNRLDWLTGCWQSESGKTREVWSQSEDGYYFGYSVVARDTHVVFFEQMRIDPAPMPVFNAYPSGAGPSAFPAVELSAHSVTFANPAHDFPQKITYTREGAALNAVISRMDDSSPGYFNYVACTEGGTSD
ncbi:MAG: DUF6265 family protein [Hyphomonadaceae bacterium]|nr:DUF6265 family protein [Hyphomonadaceae bacterium]